MVPLIFRRTMACLCVDRKCGEMGNLYERADIYDLVESDERTNALVRDWKEFLGDIDIHTFLDVSVGTGGLTLPLHELGIELYGSDLSKAMLTRCQQKALDKGVDMELRCSDFRELSCWDGMKFDCVASTGNALGYVDNVGVAKAIEQMDALVKDGGYIYIDSRNWEKIQRDKQRFYFYNPFYNNGNRINLTQVWDHNTDGSITFNLLYSFERDEKIFQRETFEEHYIPFSYGMIESKLEELGYGVISLRSMPCRNPEPDFAEMDWYRLLAKKK